MLQYCITKKRINKFVIPESYDKNIIQLGIPVINDEAKKIGLIEIGDIVLPSGEYGINSKRNAYGFELPDKTKPLERRYVSTNWIHPFGNLNAAPVAVDIYKFCYQKIKIDPYGIELQLYQNNNQQFVIVNITDEIRNKYMKEAINLMLEIYGICYVFNDVIQIKNETKRKRCNWEILPPGEKPSTHLKKQLKKMNKKTNTFDIARLNHIEKYKATTIVEGINGFKGYYAYLFDNYCVLESAFYGNATYIIPKENWEEMSQKTKKELINKNIVIEKIDHTKNWKESIDILFKELGTKKYIE